MGMSGRTGTATVRRKVKRPEVLGVTSDGVKILKQNTRGPRNLSDAQVRQIVDGMVEAVRRRNLLALPDDK